MRLFRRIPVVLGLIVFTPVLVCRWLNANRVGGQVPAEPFRIAGNFYYRSDAAVASRSWISAAAHETPSHSPDTATAPNASPNSANASALLG